MYLYPLPPGPLYTLDLTHLGHLRALSWAPCPPLARGEGGGAVGITASFSLKVSWGWICSISLRFSEITVSAALSAAAAAAKSLQSCPTLWDPIDRSPRGSTVPGILQARTPERVAISFSKAWKWKVKVKSLSRVLLLATPWTAAYQAPPSMGFSRQEYWSGVPLPLRQHY